MGNSALSTFLIMVFIMGYTATIIANITLGNPILPVDDFKPEKNWLNVPDWSSLDWGSKILLSPLYLANYLKMLYDFLAYSFKTLVNFFFLIFEPLSWNLGFTALNGIFKFIYTLSLVAVAYEIANKFPLIEIISRIMGGKS